MAQVTLEDVSKVYPDGTCAVSALDLSVDDGELLVLVGPSGCGKTTALRMVAGLEAVTEGSVRIGDRDVTHLPPQDRDVAMVFQSYALYPHLDVRGNIGFGLKIRKVPRNEIDRRVREVARVLDLEDHLDRKPAQLSGGQRQRVAMGRAIIRNPQAFLMDEPLSNLDAKLRVQMRVEVARIQRDLAATTIYVTHDQTEAMTLGDRVAVMRRGVLQQVAPPQVLYDRPANLFVAGFIGSPAMALVEAHLGRTGDDVRLHIGDQVLGVPDRLLARRPALLAYEGRHVVVGIRPEGMEDASLAGETAPESTMTSRAELVEAMGSEVLVHFTVDAPPAATADTQDLAVPAGLAVDRRRHSMVVARFSPRTDVKEGSPVTVAVDTDRLQVFDPDTGLAVWDGEGRDR